VRPLRATSAGRRGQVRTVLNWTRAEFMEGFVRLGYDSLGKVKAGLSSLQARHEACARGEASCCVFRARAGIVCRRSDRAAGSLAVVACAALASSPQRVSELADLCAQADALEPRRFKEIYGFAFDASRQVREGAATRRGRSLARGQIAQRGGAGRAGDVAETRARARC
jgi:hypothetical protein